MKDRSEWIAVPVPDAGIAADVVEAARRTVLEYSSASNAAGRFWELSGSIMRCSECGRVMNPQKSSYRRRSGERAHVHYYRCPRAYGYDGECSHRKNHRADRLEPEVWGIVSELMKDPERLREDLEAMIELERAGRRGDPAREAKGWLDKLAATDRMRRNYQEMAAKGLMTFEELAEELGRLKETRSVAERELGALRTHQERVEQLEKDKEALLRSYQDVAPEALEKLSPEERNHLYKVLRLKVRVHPNGDVEIDGSAPKKAQALVHNGLTWASGASTSARSSPTGSCARSSRSAWRCRGTRSSNTRTDARSKTSRAAI